MDGGGAQSRLYRRTAAGTMAVETDDRSIPSDYRRILALLEEDTHEDVVRGFLRRYADALIADWLREIEELGLAISMPAGPERDLDFTSLLGPRRGVPPRVPAEDQARREQGAQAAGRELSRGGVSLAADRLAHRTPLGKPASETAVLVVEDDPDQMALADLRLSLAGYRVRTAASARAMVEALREEPLPDVILLDVMLPDGDGFDLLARIRRHPRLALLPVIMLTARTDPEDIRKGLALGADGYVTKPYSKTVLAEALRAVLKVPAPS